MIIIIFQIQILIAMEHSLDDLTYLLVNQMAAFNSPVWFNVGAVDNPQCSACFIIPVEDSMESIMDLAKTEALLFKHGSGTGTNLSAIRSSKEHLSGGGLASGPVSFMKGYDAFAGVIKSGGRTRRAAKLSILDAEHPDIVEFINCKSEEEKKAWALIDAGYDGSIDGPAYGTISFQNANNSVRVTDGFMELAIEKKDWNTYGVTHNNVVDTYKANDLIKQIAEATHICGDPGMMFHTTINRWHTVPNSGMINSANPCIEYMHLDNSACNLASLNLMKFVNDDNSFNINGFKAAVRIMITAMEILVGNSSYPTKKIEQNSHDYRPLGLGYTNLGALLMAQGIPYDSDKGRAWAGSITAIMTGTAYEQSAIIARDCGGPFAGYEKNKDAMLKVIMKHKSEVFVVGKHLIPDYLYDAAWDSWCIALAAGELHGFRNSQASVMAPCGTIGLMMDCDTTGIEPDHALVKYKKLVGGGVMKIVNNIVPKALKTLGYSDYVLADAVRYIERNGTLENYPLKKEHQAVFDCAFKAEKGTRTIDYMGHLKMVAAVQPFISGAISKTINVPNEATVEDIENAYIEAWKMGIKAVSIYRDGSKRTQPLNTSLKVENKLGEFVTNMSETKTKPIEPVRRRLPDERQSITHKINIAGHEGYITVGLYEDGQPGEIFLRISKEGSTISGFADAFALAISYALQYGVPLQALVNKFTHIRFEPSGLTKNKEIKIAKSFVDYIFRWMATKFLTEKKQFDAGVNIPISVPSIWVSPEKDLLVDPSYEISTWQIPTDSQIQDYWHEKNDLDAPSCATCGSIMTRNGSCYKCANCGETSGCS